MSATPDPVRFGVVLLIEDDLLVARAIGDMVEELGGEAVLAATTEAGLGMLKARPVDLVLSDIEVPGDLDGLALAKRLKQSDPGIPVVLMTGNPRKAREADGEFAVLIKPFGLRQLSEAMTAASFRLSGMKRER